MKKAISCFLFAAICFAGHAQKSPWSNTKVGDTITNATTGYVTVTKLNDGLVSVDAVLTKVSGTVAGYALLQGSNDGVNWYDINTDTLTYANQTTNKKSWAISGKFPYRDMRVAFKGTGSTEVAIPQISYTRRDG